MSANQSIQRLETPERLSGTLLRRVYFCRREGKSRCQWCIAACSLIFGACNDRATGALPQLLIGALALVWRRGYQKRTETTSGHPLGRAPSAVPPIPAACPIPMRLCVRCGEVWVGLGARGHVHTGWPGRRLTVERADSRDWS